ncbi:MAG: twin-arginine translocation signal domain-containing protein [Deltaproteobacteria bacterium]|nr:twin-arginine translocation signal domain-containing protein [Deltaproteobacteria bacterium]
MGFISRRNFLKQVAAAGARTKYKVRTPYEAV